MTYAFVNDVAASWEHYRRFADALAGPIPEGLVLHAAGPTDEGFRIIAVWETEDAWERFRAERLGAEDEAGAHVPPVFRPMLPAHVVLGGRRLPSAVDGPGQPGLDPARSRETTTRRSP